MNIKWPWSKTESSVSLAEPEEGDPVATTAVIAQPPRLPAQGPARKPDLSVDEMAEYARVSQEIGIDCCSDLVREKLLRCLSEEHIHVYNRAQVIKFLDHKLGKDWEWRGLRTVDAEHLGGWYDGGGEDVREVDFAKEPYRGAVPLPVLLTVQKIQKAVPEVFFYVSAPKNDDGDPFLAVTNRYLGMYIVERWDEPDFRER